MLRSIALVLASVAVAHADPAALRIPVHEGLKWGFIDGTGAVVIPFQYASASAAGCADDRYIDPSGKKLSTAPVRACIAFGPEGLVPAPNGTAAFMDRTGKFVRIATAKKTTIGELSPFHDGLARAFVEETGSWGWLNPRGAWAIEPTFGSLPEAKTKKLLEECDDLIEKNKVGDMPNGTGRAEKDIECFSASELERAMKGATTDFSEGLAGVKVGGTWRFITKTGATAFETTSEREPGPFSNSRARMTTGNDTAYFIDRTGKTVIAGPFSDASDFHDGFALVDGRFIDVNGKPGPVIPKGATATSFSGGLAATRLGGKYGYLDVTGTWAIQPRFDVATAFENGFARVNFGRFDAVIDATGKAIWIETGGKAAFEEPAPAPVESKPVAPSPPKIVPLDARFVLDGETVRDTQTGLQWAAHDSGADLDADAAISFAKSYRGGGFGDWRLPTADELAALAAPTLVHHESGDCTNGKSTYVITPLIHLSCGLAWSGTTRDDGVVGFGFISGTPRVSKRTENKNYRALVVRRP